MATRSYPHFKERMDQLASLLPPVVLDGAYTERDRDLIRAYVLLAHAEVESFCEDLVLSVIKEAERRSATAKSSRVLSRLVLFKAGHNKDLEALTSASITDACTFYRSIVASNHGIKRNDLLRLFLPLGLSHSDLDETVLATMDAFGSRRGDFAHRSFKVNQPLDPSSEKATIDRIMPELSRIEQLTKALI